MSKTPRTDEKMYATAMNRSVVVPVKFAQQLETELADKDKQLAEARADVERFDRQRRAGWTEIKRLNELLLNTNRVHIENQRLQKNLQDELEANKKMSDEIDYLRARGAAMTKEVCGKDKLIEQMREALKEINSECGAANFSSFNQVKHAVIVSTELSEAALAAERGE